MTSKCAAFVRDEASTADDAFRDSCTCGHLRRTHPGDGACIALGCQEAVDHPAHYGGADNPYETIRVIEAWDLGFCLGNCVKYISRAGKKGDRREDLLKALWYLKRELGEK